MQCGRCFHLTLDPTITVDLERSERKGFSPPPLSEHRAEGEGWTKEGEHQKQNRGARQRGVSI